jgi:hypothetical protein
MCKTFNKLHAGSLIRFPTEEGGGGGGEGEGEAPTAFFTHTPPRRRKALLLQMKYGSGLGGKQ